MAHSFRGGDVGGWVLGPAPREAPVFETPAPNFKHLHATSCCPGCSTDLPRRSRCTVDPDDLYRASVDELLTGTGLAAKGCAADRDDELERRLGFSTATTTPKRRPGLLARLTRRTRP